MNWTNKHAFYLGTVIGKLHNELRNTFDKEEEEVYFKVLGAIQTIVEIEVYGVQPHEWNNIPEQEEDNLQ